MAHQKSRCGSSPDASATSTLPHLTSPPPQLSLISAPRAPCPAPQFSPRGSTITLNAVFVPDPASTTTGTSGSVQAQAHDDGAAPQSARSVVLSIRKYLSTSSRGLFMPDVALEQVHEGDVEANAGQAPGGVRPKPGQPSSPAPTAGILRISVVDCGAGISPENQKRLFKEIVQFSPEKLQAGTASPPHMRHALASSHLT